MDTDAESISRSRRAWPSGPDYSREHRLAGMVCGVDEVGRGPLAGPVIAAAVILFPDKIPTGIDDSKRLPRAKREALAAAIHECAIVGIGRAEVAEIDRLNILQASLLAMRRAVDALGENPSHALVDGNRLPILACPATTIVGGDGLSLSIAAASIVAKVLRDALMVELAQIHPGYGWERNAGYGTPEHLAALARLGPTVQHRRSFAPVRDATAGLTARPAPGTVSAT